MRFGSNDGNAISFTRSGTLGQLRDDRNNNSRSQPEIRSTTMGHQQLGKLKQHGAPEYDQADENDLPGHARSSPAPEISSCNGRRELRVNSRIDLRLEHGSRRKLVSISHKAADR
jgi:hypothetical protein